MIPIAVQLYLCMAAITAQVYFWMAAIAAKVHLKLPDGVCVAVKLWAQVLLWLLKDSFALLCGPEDVFLRIHEYPIGFQ